MGTRMALLVLMVAVISLGLVGCTTMPTTGYDAAKSLQGNEKYSEAIKKYQEFIAGDQFDELDPYAQYNIGMCYKEMNDTAAAAAAFKKVVDQYPQSEPAQWAKVEMQMLEKKPEPKK